MLKQILAVICLSIISPQLEAQTFHLEPAWSIRPGDRTYVNSTGGGNTPNQRTIGYNALSNQVYIVSRAGNASALVTVNVVDATTGADLYRLNTNGLIASGITLNVIGVSDDGSIYAGNMTTDALTNPFCLYRWENSNSNTPPQIVYSGNPDGQSAAFRWGDSMHVRGSGTNTQIILDDNSGNYVSVLTPIDATLSEFVATMNFREAYAGKIGRSIHWSNGNTFWQKRSSNKLERLEYDFSSNPSVAQTIASYTSLPISIGPTFMDTARNVLLGINFSGSTSLPDTLALYDVADFENPVQLDSKAFPINKQANNHAIGQVILAGNRVFAVNGNNGVLALILNSGAPTPPTILTQPSNIRVITGSSGSLSVTASDIATYQWQLNETDITDATNSVYTITNAQLTDAGSYRVIVSNNVGPTTSSNAIVTVEPAANHYSLSPAWSIAPGTVPYVTKDPSNTPNQRSIAYNPFTQRLYLVSRTSATEGLVVNILNPNSGELLGSLDTTGIAPVAGNNIILIGICVADDGAIYAGNASVTSGGGAATFNLYRWANEASAPALVFSAEPADQTSTFRWGDAMDIRGAGLNTQVIIDEGNSGLLAALLVPTDETMETFTNIPLPQYNGNGSIGRSLQFGNGDTFWQKRHTTPNVVSAPLKLTSFDPVNQTSALITNYTGFPNSLGALRIDSARNLLAGVDFASSTNSPDAVALYEISDLHLPMLLGRYSFATNQQPNANFIGQVVFSDTKIFAINGNNGVVAFNIVPPGGEVLTLSVSQSGNNISLTWSDSNAILEGTFALGSPSWTDLTTAGQTNYSQSATSGMQFFRLRK